MDFSIIQPNQHHDWLNQRSETFQGYFPLGEPSNKKKNTAKKESIFDSYSNGIVSSRDAWVYNFDRDALAQNMQNTIDFYNQQVKDYKAQKGEKSVEEFIDNNPQKISWDRATKKTLSQGKLGNFYYSKIRQGMYRPFSKQWLYFDRQFNAMVLRQPYFFPKPETKNLAICVSGVGASKVFSALIVDTVPNLHFLDSGQCFPFYTYQSEESQQKTKELPTGEKKEQKIENISKETLLKFQKHYQDKKISKWCVFYFVYGLLHSPEYKNRFAADLKKVLPRLPFLKEKIKNFWDFSRIGKELAELHLNYEDAKEYALTEEKSEKTESENYYKVEKMRFSKTKNIKKSGAQNKAGRESQDRSKIIYNPFITLTDIPEEAYQYQVNGKSAIEWVMERYQIKTNKDSGILNDPNQYSPIAKNPTQDNFELDSKPDPKYILSLLKKVITVSVQSVHLIKKLPPLD